MLPVYVYKIGILADDNKSWSDLTYADAEGKDQPVKGLRLLELKPFGAIRQVYDVMRSLFDEQTDLRTQDFSVERKGGGTDTSYITLPRAPRGMPENVHALIPSQDDVQQMVLAALPTAIASSGNVPATQPSANPTDDMNF